MIDPSSPNDPLIITVDLVILAVREDCLQVLLIKRANEPFRGQCALPGGHLEGKEDLHEAAMRELAEETDLDGGTLHLEQLATYGAPGRDPRGHVVSVAYLGIAAAHSPLPTAGSDACTASWVSVKNVRGTLAFDHDQILGDGIKRASERLESTTLGTAFCHREFTIGDLRHVYEAVWGMRLDPRNFNRKVLNTEGFIQPTGNKRVPAIGRPATLYERGPAQTLNPPLLRDVDQAGGKP